MTGILTQADRLRCDYTRLAGVSGWAGAVVGFAVGLAKVAAAAAARRAAGVLAACCPIRWHCGGLLLASGAPSLVGAGVNFCQRPHCPIALGIARLLAAP